jgi:Nucleotidyl transferase AbiEii toxin, Type IV TA system
VANPVGLSAEQSRLLGALKRAPGVEGLYLAGGTAIAWHFEHRRSMDLDLFTRTALQPLAPIGKAVARTLKARKLAESEVAVSFKVGQVEIDVVRYEYPPLVAPRPGPEGFPIAGPLDLSVMKLGAISKRGLRRDFWDLQTIATEGRIPLSTMLAAYKKRFKSEAADLYHVVRSLTYFDDAEVADPRLVGLSLRDWGRIKAWFQEQAPAASTLLLRRR